MDKTASPGQENVAFNTSTNKPMLDMSGIKQTTDDTPLEDIQNMYVGLGKDFNQLTKNAADNVGARQRELVGNDFGATNPYMYNTYYEPTANAFQSQMLVEGTQQALTEGMRRGKAQAEADFKNAQNNYNNAYNQYQNQKTAAANAKIKAAEAATEYYGEGVGVGEAANLEGLKGISQDELYGNQRREYLDKVNPVADWNIQDYRDVATDATLNQFGYNRDQYNSWSQEERDAFWGRADVGNYWTDQYRLKYFQEVGGDSMREAYVRNRDNASAALTKAWQYMNNMVEDFTVEDKIKVSQVVETPKMGVDKDTSLSDGVDLNDWRTKSSNEYIDQYVPEDQRDEIKQLRDKTLENQKAMTAGNVQLSPEMFNAVWNGYLMKVNQAVGSNEDKAAVEKAFAEGSTITEIEQSRDNFLRDVLGVEYQDVLNYKKAYDENPELIDAVNNQVAQAMGQTDTIEVADGEKWYKIGNEWKQLEEGTIVLFAMPGALNDQGEIVDKDFKEFVDNYSKLYDPSVENTDELLSTINDARRRYLETVMVGLYAEDYYDDPFSQDVMRAVMYSKNNSDYKDDIVTRGMTAQEILDEFIGMIEQDPEKARNTYARLLEKANESTGSILIKNYENNSLGMTQIQNENVGSQDGAYGNNVLYGASTDGRHELEDLSTNQAIATLTVLDSAIRNKDIDPAFFGATGDNWVGTQIGGAVRSWAKGWDAIAAMGNSMLDVMAQPWNYISGEKKWGDVKSGSISSLIDQATGKDVKRNWTTLNEVFSTDDKHIQDTNPSEYQQKLSQLQRNTMGAVVDPLLTYMFYGEGKEPIDKITGLGDNVVSTGKGLFDNIFTVADTAGSFIQFAGGIAIDAAIPGFITDIASLGSKVIKAGATGITRSIGSRLFTNADDVMSIARALAKDGEITSDIMKQARNAAYDLTRASSAESKALAKASSTSIANAITGSGQYVDDIAKVAMENSRFADNSAEFSKVLAKTSDDAAKLGYNPTIKDFEGTATQVGLTNAANNATDAISFAQRTAKADGYTIGNGFTMANYAKDANKLISKSTSNLASFMYSSLENSVSTLKGFTNAAWKIAQGSDAYGAIRAINNLGYAGRVSTEALETAVKQTAGAMGREMVATVAISQFTGLAIDDVAELPSKVKKLLSNVINSRTNGATVKGLGAKFVSSLSDDAITDLTKQFIQQNALKNAMAKGKNVIWTGDDTLRVLSLNGWDGAARIGLVKQFGRELIEDTARDLLYNYTNPQLTLDGWHVQTPEEYFSDPSTYIFNLGFTGVRYVAGNIRNQAKMSSAVRQVEKASNAIASSGAKVDSPEMKKLTKKLVKAQNKAQKYSSMAFRKGNSLDTAMKNLEKSNEITSKAMKQLFDDQGLDFFTKGIANKNMTKDEFFKHMENLSMKPSESMWRAFNLITVNSTNNFGRIRSGLTAGTSLEKITGLGTIQDASTNLKIQYIFDDVRQEMTEKLKARNDLTWQEKSRIMYNEMTERVVALLDRDQKYSGTRDQLNFYFNDLIDNIESGLKDGTIKKVRLGYTPIGSFYSETSFDDLVNRGMTFGGEAVDFTTANPAEVREVNARDLLDAISRGDEVFELKNENGDVIKKYKLDARGLNLQDNLVVYNNARLVHKYLDPFMGKNGNEFAEAAAKTGNLYIADVVAGKNMAANDVVAAQKEVDYYRNKVYKERKEAIDKEGASLKSGSVDVKSEFQTHPELMDEYTKQRDVLSVAKARLKAEQDIISGKKLPSNAQAKPAQLFNLYKPDGNLDIEAGLKKYNEAYEDIMRDVNAINNGKINPVKLLGQPTMMVDAIINDKKMYRSIGINDTYVNSLISAAQNNGAISHDAVFYRMIQNEANAPGTMKNGKFTKIKGWKSAINNKKLFAKGSMEEQILKEFGDGTLNNVVRFGDKDIAVEKLQRKVSVSQSNSNGIESIEEILDGVIGGRTGRKKDGTLKGSANRLKNRMVAQLRADVMNSGGTLSIDEAIHRLDQFLPDTALFEEALENKLFQKISSLENDGSSIYLIREIDNTRIKLEGVASGSDLAKAKEAQDLLEKFDNAKRLLDKSNEYRYTAQTFTSESFTTNAEGQSFVDYAGDSSDAMDSVIRGSKNDEDVYAAMRNRDNSGIGSNNDTVISMEDYSKEQIIKDIKDLSDVIDILTNDKNPAFKQYGSDIMTANRAKYDKHIKQRSAMIKRVQEQGKALYDSKKIPEFNQKVDQIALARRKNQMLNSGSDPEKIKAVTSAKPVAWDYARALGVINPDNALSMKGNPDQFIAIKNRLSNISKDNANGGVIAKGVIDAKRNPKATFSTDASELAYQEARIQANTFGGNYAQLQRALEFLEKSGHKNADAVKSLRAAIEDLSANELTLEQLSERLGKVDAKQGRVEQALFDYAQPKTTSDGLEQSMVAMFADASDAGAAEANAMIGRVDAPSIKSGKNSFFTDKELSFASVDNSARFESKRGEGIRTYTTSNKYMNKDVKVEFYLDENDGWKSVISFADDENQTPLTFDDNDKKIYKDVFSEKAPKAGDTSKLIDEIATIYSNSELTNSVGFEERAIGFDGNKQITTDQVMNSDQSFTDAFNTREKQYSYGRDLKNRINKPKYNQTYEEFMKNRAQSKWNEYSNDPVNDPGTDILDAYYDYTDAEMLYQNYIDISNRFVNEVEKMRADYDEKVKAYNNKVKSLEDFKKRSGINSEDKIFKKYLSPEDYERYTKAKEDYMRAKKHVEDKESDFYISRDGVIFTNDKTVGKNYGKLSDMLTTLGFDDDLVKRVEARIKTINGEEVYELDLDDMEAIRSERKANKKMTKTISKSKNSGEYIYKNSKDFIVPDTKNDISKYRTGKNLNSMVGEINGKYGAKMGKDIDASAIYLDKDYATMLNRFSDNIGGITAGGKKYAKVMQATIDLGKWIQNIQMAGGASWVNSLTITQIRGAIFSDPRMMLEYIKLAGDMKNSNAVAKFLGANMARLQEIALETGDVSILTDLNGALSARPGLEDAGTINDFITSVRETPANMKRLIKENGIPSGAAEAIGKDLDALFDHATFRNALPVLRAKMLIANVDRAETILHKRFPRADVDDLHKAALAMSYAKTTAYFMPSKTRNMDIAQFLDKIKTEKMRDFVMATTGAKGKGSLLDTMANFCFALRYKMQMAGRVYTGMKYLPSNIRDGLQLMGKEFDLLQGGDFGSDAILNKLGTKFMRSSNTTAIRSMIAIMAAAAVTRMALGMPTEWDDISFFDPYTGELKVPDLLNKFQTVGQIWLPNDIDENGMPTINKNEPAYNIDMFSSIFTLPNSLIRTVDKAMHPEQLYAAPQRGLGQHMGGPINDFLNSPIPRAIGDELIGSNLLSPYKAMYECLMDTTYFGNNIYEKKYFADGSINPNYDQARNWKASIFHLLGLDGVLSKNGYNDWVKGKIDDNGNRRKEYVAQDQVGTVAGSGILQHEYASAIISWINGDALDGIIEAGELPIKKTNVSSQARTEFNTRVKNLMIKSYHNYVVDIDGINDPETKDARFNQMVKECADLMSTWSKKYDYVLGTNQELVPAAVKTMVAIIAGEVNDKTDYVQSAYWKATQMAQIQQNEDLFLSDEDLDAWIESGRSSEEFAAERTKRSKAYNDAMDDEYKARQALIAAGFDESKFSEMKSKDIEAQQRSVNRKVFEQIQYVLNKPVGEFKNFKEMKEYYEARIEEATSTKSKRKLAETYNTYVTDAIAPYINQYGANILNTGRYNGKYLSNSIADYIIIPKGEYYGGKSPRANYLKDLFHVGYKDNTALPSDKEAIETFRGALKMAGRGEMSSAAARINSLLRRVRNGEVYVSERDYSDIINLKARLSARSK